MNIPIASQAAALRHIFSVAAMSGETPERTLEWAAAGIRNLDWLAERHETVRALARLFDTFPGMEIVSDGQ